VAISSELHFAHVDELWLDPTNPRLGRHVAGEELEPDVVLEAMQDWELLELANSFLRSHFWPQEALIVHREDLYGEPRLVVVEGNRRLATLKFLQLTTGGQPPSTTWSRLVQEHPPGAELFERVPYLLVDDRSDVDAYLGFRHVTGIKQWRPAEKAQYIARLLNDGTGRSFVDVAREIGSRSDAVRRHYAAFQLLLQLEALDTDVTPQQTEERFSVLFLSLRQSAVQAFLGLDLSARATPDTLAIPVPSENEDDLENFAIWLFGTEDRDPLFTDSRRVGDFARVLASPEAVIYLRETDNPQLSIALRKANVDKQDVLTAVRRATDAVEEALTQIHLVREDDEVRTAVERFDKSARELVARAIPITSSTS
jgi:hypothetical protein